jgi:hypothetical protein
LDLVPVTVDAFSLALLVLTFFIGWRAIRAFRQSKQAVIESASLLEAIVTALTSRIQASELAADQLRSDFNTVSQRNDELANGQVRMQKGYEDLLGRTLEALTNDQKFVLELEQLKSRIVSVPQGIPRSGQRVGQSRPSSGPAPLSDGDVLSSLTPTENELIVILGREGPQIAPELGQRLGKSREHMARLMKKLYFEGYVDRETNKTPFRYRLNEKIRPALGSPAESVTEKAQD